MSLETILLFFTETIYTTNNIEFIDVITDHLIKYGIKISLIDVLDNIESKFYTKDKPTQEGLINVFKYIHSTLKSLTEDEYIKSYIAETETDIDSIYRYLFTKINDYSMITDNLGVLHKAVLLSVGLDTIKKYKHNIALFYLGNVDYPLVIKIFYLNYHSLDEKDRYTDFYRKLNNVLGTDYSSYKIEEDPVVKLFSFSITNIIQGYL